MYQSYNILQLAQPSLRRGHAGVASHTWYFLQDSFPQTKLICTSLPPSATGCLSAGWKRQKVEECESVSIPESNQNKTNSRGLALRGKLWTSWLRLYFIFIPLCALPSVFLSTLAVPQLPSSPLTTITFPLTKFSIKKWSSHKNSSHGTFWKAKEAVNNNGLWYCNRTAAHIRKAKPFAFRTSFFWLEMPKAGDCRRYLTCPWVSLMKEYF